MRERDIERERDIKKERERDIERERENIEKERDIEKITLLWKHERSGLTEGDEFSRYAA